jgi:hypothetical protein
VVETCQLLALVRVLSNFHDWVEAQEYSILLLCQSCINARYSTNRSAAELPSPRPERRSGALYSASTSQNTSHNSQQSFITFHNSIAAPPTHYSIRSYKNATRLFDPAKASPIRVNVPLLLPEPNGESFDSYSKLSRYCHFGLLPIVTVKAG